MKDKLKELELKTKAKRDEMRKIISTEKDTIANDNFNDLEEYVYSNINKEFKPLDKWEYESLTINVGNNPNRLKDEDIDNEMSEKDKAFLAKRLKKYLDREKINQAEITETINHLKATEESIENFKKDYKDYPMLLDFYMPNSENLVEMLKTRLDSLEGDILNETNY